MSEENERRLENRSTNYLKDNPIECWLITENKKISLQIINYHYRGACFKIGIGDRRPTNKNSYLKFQIGFKDLPEKINFQVVWETISENGLFGVEFSQESHFVLSRAERFSTHKFNTPVVSCKDPLNPNRLIYFNVLNISKTGLLFSTSMTNRHIFPGMEMKNAKLEIPSMGGANIDVYIENARSGDKNDILFGASINNENKKYVDLISKYLSNLGSLSDSDSRLDKLVSEKLMQKELAKHLTIKEVKDQKTYEQVLKLRFLGYQKAGKVKKGITYHAMGEGLDKEGVVLTAYLAGQLVASCEFRFEKIHGLKLSEKVNLSALQEVKMGNLSEVNKLVVHPSAQNTDVVLGIFQRIHALAMLNGRPDGIIAAEDKLVPLYERLGFKKIGYSYPHPIKTNTNLHLMLIKSEAYATSDGMNAYAWSVAFQESHDFFSKIGVQSSSALSVKKLIDKLVTPILLGVLKLRKNLHKKFRDKDKTINDPITVERNKIIIDPLWTKQHVNATVLLPYILSAYDLIGVDQTNKILSEFNMTIDYFKRNSNWVSIEFFDNFLNLYTEHADPYTLNKEAGYRSTSKEVLGVNYFLVKHFVSPQIAFKSFERFFPKFNKTRVYKVIDSGINYCRIRITNPDTSLLPKNNSAKENWVAILDSYVQMITGRPAQIKVIKSSFDGDAYCEYLVRWKNPFLTFKGITSLGSMSLIFSWFVMYLSQKMDPTLFKAVLISGVLLTTSLVFSAMYLRAKRKYAEIMESFTTFEKEADEKYRELQDSKLILESQYREGKILEKISREIQETDDFSSIFEKSLHSICTRFSFSRAFIMVKDGEDEILRTIAVHGTEGDIKALWSFKVDVSKKRDDPLVLSSVYLSGQSILISDIDQHTGRFNAQSQALIKQLNTRGFAIVPIPSANKNWGVIVADKGISSDTIARRDLTAIQRIAQTLGLALDKKSKIENEVRIRKIFEKYVPSAVVESTLSVTDPKLGGEYRESICLFLDIRNFTELSESLPAQRLVDLLNQIFTEFQNSVQNTGGTIDKFLGDGALVTWGALPGSEAKPQSALNTAYDFLRRLDELNELISKQGFGRIRVGMGIHKGPVIAGNIGASERMEFTVIGSTVNIASRLEQLTKLFKTSIVISEEFVSYVDSQKWKVHKDISVRGLDQSMVVASYHPEGYDEKNNEVGVA